MGIPGDLVAHFLIGAILGWIVYVTFGDRRNAVYWILGMAVFKELFFDLHANVLNGQFFEPIKDVVVSILGAYLVLFFLRKPFR